MTASIVNHITRGRAPATLDLASNGRDGDLAGVTPIPGQLWEREVERSVRFDREGFDAFTEITAHAALAREALERSRTPRQ